MHTVFNGHYNVDMFS